MIVIDVLTSGGNRATVTARDSEDSRLIHSDCINLASAQSRTRFSRAVEEKLKAPEAADEVEKLLLEKLDELRDVPAPKPDRDAGEPDHRALLEAMPQDVRSEAEAMSIDPDLMRRIVDDIATLGVAGEKALTATNYVIGTSRLLARPLAAIVQGHTSSGKSFIIERVAELFPPEAVLMAQQLTPQALFHMPPGSLRHRFIVAGERSRCEDDEAAEASRALREMISSGKLSKLMPSKNEHGRIVTEHIEQAGPIAYIESTTQSRIFDEDLNRCVLLSTDERPEQTRRILTTLAGGCVGPRQDTAQIVLRHHAFQRLLATEPAVVVIEFAQRLAALFPSQRPEARRAFGHILSMIEAVALLHCRQRQRNGNGAIVATAEDYAVVRYLLAGPMSRSLGGAVSDGAKRLWGRLTWPQGTFTSADVFRHEGYSERQVRGWLMELARAGFLKVVGEGGRGKPYTYQIADDPPDSEALSPLPTVEQVCGEGGDDSILPSEVTAGNAVT